MTVIETRGLSKDYGGVAALADLSLRVDAEEIFGFLGPNGAGKTTTIRLLLGLISPSRGEASVFGRRVTAAPQGREDVGYLPGEWSLWPTLTGAATLSFLERLTGRPATRRNELVERLGLTPRDLARRVRTYSDGMKQKLGIVQALQCEPRLVLLDEPTKGLDPLMQQSFYELLLDLPARGTTVFFSSHILPEVERVCDRVAMLRGGQLAMVGNVDEIRQAMPRRIVLTLSADVAIESWSGIGRVIAATSRRVELLVDAGRVPDVVRRIAALPLVDVSIEPPSFEAAFLERYR